MPPTTTALSPQQIAARFAARFAAGFVGFTALGSVGPWMKGVDEAVGGQPLVLLLSLALAAIAVVDWRRGERAGHILPLWMAGLGAFALLGLGIGVANVALLGFGDFHPGWGLILSGVGSTGLVVMSLVTVHLRVSR